MLIWILMPMIFRLRRMLESKMGGTDLDKIINEAKEEERQRILYP